MHYTALVKYMRFYWFVFDFCTHCHTTDVLLRTPPVVTKDDFVLVDAHIPYFLFREPSTVTKGDSISTRFSPLTFCRIGFGISAAR